MRLCTAAAWLALGCAASSGVIAQIRLPGVRLPQLPLSGTTDQLGQSLGSVAAGLDPTATDTLRRTNLENLIRQNQQLIEADSNGEPMLRGQLVGLDLSPAARVRIQAAGFMLESQHRLDPLDMSIDVWRAPAGVSTHRALQHLRQLEPTASFDYDHLYSVGASSPIADAADGTRRPDQSAAEAHIQSTAVVRVGLIDGGLQLDHVAFRHASIALWGCDGRQIPSAHGTAVASLLIGDAAPFRGAAPQARLYAADVYCGQPSGGAIDAIAAAMGWMGANQVSVINMSLVGPDNVVLRQLVKQMSTRGYLIVAAVGNDGPAAPPLYPAAYPGVVGVTAVDAHRRVLLEAQRGAQVTFCAPGADMAAANSPTGFVGVRGTSFAAPLVAGLLASRLLRPDPALARSAVDALAQNAIDLGAAGRDDTYGFGLVAEDLRVAPNIMQAAMPLQ